MAIRLDLETFESLVSSARAEYLDRVKINFGKLDELDLVRRLNNTPIDQWSETQLKDPPRYRCSAISVLEIDLERQIKDVPTLMVTHPDLGWKATKSINGSDVDELYARVDAHFTELREQEQRPRQIYFGSEVGGD